MVHAKCVFVAGIHLSRTWMSESFESVRWNACVYRLDLGLYSHPIEYGGNGVRTHVISNGRIPSTGNMIPRGGSNPRRCIKQDSQPNTLPASYSGPHQGQRAQHTTSELFRPPSSRTASPTHYQWAIPAPAWCNGLHVCSPSLPPMLLRGFESRLGLESSCCNMWHFLKLVARGFLRVLRFPPLLHRFNDSANKIKLQ